MERRKRSLSEPVDSLNSRAKRAAAAVLAGRTYLDVTRELGVPKQHVFYYVKKWKGTDTGAVLTSSSPSVGSCSTGSSSSQHGQEGRERTPLPICCELPPSYDTWCVFRRRKFVLKLAAMLVQEHGYSIRSAAHELNVMFSANDLVPKVSRFGVRRYVADEEWSPQAGSTRSCVHAGAARCIL